MSRRMLRHLEHATKVDLGSGARPKPGFVGIDRGAYEVEPPAEVWTFDLASGDPWPFADGQVTELYSSHLVEHLPAGEISAYEFVDADGQYSPTPGSRFTRFTRFQDALFWFMDEAWRICAPGARFELRWPALVDHRDDPPRWLTTAFLDPTHRRFIPLGTLAYFNRAERELLQVTGYAVSCDWRVSSLAQGDLGGEHVENIAELVRL